MRYSWYLAAEPSAATRSDKFKNNMTFGVP